VVSKKSRASKRGTSARISAYDWAKVAQSLDTEGTAVLPRLIEPEQCEQLSADYSREDIYRSRVVMARHGFGRGEYKYFSYPLPDILQTLRKTLYPKLAPIANRWNRAMRINVQYPVAHADFLRRCHRAGQKRPTPLILRYVQEDYNCLHQDLYGEHVFPLQATILLSRPGIDFEGGEFVVTDVGTKEKRASVVPLSHGDAVIFAVNHRPSMNGHGSASTAMRHGVSQVRRGLRQTVGIIFHDAR
jgi:hypothetical protein